MYFKYKKYMVQAQKYVQVQKMHLASTKQWVLVK